MTRPGLNTSHLLTMKAVAEYGTVSAAAGKLHISQSALSHRIREAETRLGTSLFHRKNQRLSLSRAGRHLLHAAHTILDLLERVEDDIKKMEEDIEKVVRIGVPAYGNMHWLAHVLGEFRQARPGIEIEIMADSSWELLAGLEHGKSDLVIVSSRTNNKLLHCDELFSDEMVALMPSKHGKAKQSYLSPQDFTDEVYIANNTTPEKGREYDLFFSRYHIQLKKIIPAGLPETIIELVRAGFGISILTRQALSAYNLPENLSVVPLTKDGIFAKWYVVVRQKEPADSGSRLLADTMREYAVKFGA